MTEIKEGNANIYEDLAVSDPQEMRIKAQLATKIAAIIEERQLTQTEAAKIIGITQPKLSGLLRGNFRGVSEAKMFDCLNRLGRDVTIVVGQARRTQGKGRLKVELS
ncbi:MAG: XRE family transcriptional regulator [Alcanivorax sp. Nap_24]|nr:MAG: XRE family transcriptional regulator [Alcanivorax sp. Nap_24]